MKFTKLLALLLAICMLGTMMVACNKEEKSDDTAAPGTDAPTITVNLTIKDITGKTVVDKRPVSYKGNNPILGEIIGNYCAEEGYETEPFDSNNILVQIGDMKKESGQRWAAYLQEEGLAKEFESIKDQAVSDGQHIIIALVKN